MARRIFIICAAVVAVLSSGVVVSRARTKTSADGGFRMNAGYIVSAEEEKHLAALANAGDAKSAFVLAEAFSIGEPDYAKHRFWLQRAAELGHVAAQYSFGYLLWREGRTADARRWLLTARDNAEKTGDTYTAQSAAGVLALLPGGAPAPSAPAASRASPIAIPTHPTPQ
jgi:TPR repeat protein